LLLFAGIFFAVAKVACTAAIRVTAL